MEPPSSHRIRIINESGRKVSTAAIRRGLKSALTWARAEASQVCVLLTDDAAIRDLNLRFRSIDEATDVLTFPDGEAASGDVAISLPYAERQAAARGVSLTQELGFLAIHGGLHLTGLDDQTEAERARMVRAMNEVAREAGLEPDEAWASILHDEDAA